MSFLLWKLFLASFTNDNKLSTIYEAQKSYDFVSKHGVDIYRLSSNQGNGFLFVFFFLRLEKKFIPRMIPVSKFWRVAENQSQSDKSRSSASIFVLFPKFDTSRPLHVSVRVFLKNLSSLKKNHWRKLRNYLASISTRAPSAPPMCFRLPFWRPSYFTRRGGG